MKVVILGGTGQMGRCLSAEMTNRGYEVVSVGRSSRPSVDCSEPDGVRRFLDSQNSDVVVHLAAMTSLEQCEEDPERAWRLHCLGVDAAAEWCTTRGRVLVHLSSDALFSGDSDWYRETDEVEPLNVYARTKFLGEREVLARGGTVVRTNFIGPGVTSLIASLARRLRGEEVVTGYVDCVFTPLHVADCAQAIIQLVEDPVPGLLHIGSAVPVSKFEIARSVCALVGRGSVVPGSLPQVPIRRPKSTCLHSERARQLIDIPDRGWECAVREIVLHLEGDGE